MAGCLRTALLAVLLSWCVACGHSPSPAPAAPRTDARAAQREAWGDFAQRFIEEAFQADPFFAVQAGRHELDGRMPDLSAAGIRHEIERLRAAGAAAAHFDPAALEDGQRFERDYVLYVVADELFWLERARFPFVNPAWYIDRLDPDVYLNREYAPLPQRLAGYLGYARSIPQIAAAIRANLHTPMDRTLLERGITAFAGYAQFYRHDVAPMFAAVKDPQAQHDLHEADEAAARAMDALVAWLKSQRAHPAPAFALGEALYHDMLRSSEGLDLPLGRLREIGQADLERNTAALRAACAEFAPGAPLARCVSRMGADKPAGNTLDAARAQLRMLKDFIQQHQAVTIPAEDQAHVAEAPPYNRANFAYINVPGPYDHGVAATYNIAPPDPSWPKAVQKAYLPGRAILLFTSVHEVWPGHFLQFLHSNRNPSKIEALWVSSQFAEGWAHYAEEMMWDEGLGEGRAEDHIGQIIEALLRDVRFLSSIGLHTGGMTVAQSERMFRERAFQDPGNARQQAARGVYDPGYLCYTLGKLLIRRLRDDWIASRELAPGIDPKTQWRAFHDAFLSHGGPPVALVRRQMLGGQSTQDGAEML